MLFFFLLYFGMVICLLLIYEFRSLFDVFFEPTTTTHYKHLHFGRICWICSAYCILYIMKSKSVWVHGCVSLRFFIRASQNSKQIYVCTAINQTETLHSQNSNGWALVCVCLLQSDRNDVIWHSVMATERKQNPMLSCVMWIGLSKGNIRIMYQFHNKHVKWHQCAIALAISINSSKWLHSERCLLDQRAKPFELIPFHSWIHSMWIQLDL